MATSAAYYGGSNARMQRYRRFYFLHSAFVLIVLIFGMMNNGGNRKYIPVDPKGLFNLLSTQPSGVINGDVVTDMGSCRKAYVNVHSSTIEEDFAAICCSGSDYSSTFKSKERNYQSDLCHPRILPIIGISIQQLPFARRLTRLMEAWVLPLLPIIIRLIYQLVTCMRSFLSRYWNSQNRNGMIQREGTSLSNSQASSSSLSSNTSAASLDKIITGSSSTVTAQPQQSSYRLIQATLQRLLFYFLLLNFRGWGLYIGANALEDYVILPWFTGNTVVSPLRTNSMSDVEHDLRYKGSEPECWYKEVLKAHHISAMENDGHSDCYGRPFDFSDHVVLFLAHYLPIFVMEMLLYFSFPFWDPSGMGKQNQVSRGSIWNVFHASLFLYMHLLLLHALYQTAAYFHTPAEILVGYVVSLIMQLPVMYLMCSEGSHRVRKYLGLPSEGGMVMSEKGD